MRDQDAVMKTNPRYCDSNEDGDDGDHDPGHVDVVVGDNPGRAQEDVVVEDDEDRHGEDAGGEERVEDLGDDAELDVSNLVGDVVLDPANLRNIVLYSLHCFPKIISCNP